MQHPRTHRPSRGPRPSRRVGRRRPRPARRRRPNRNRNHCHRWNPSNLPRRPPQRAAHHQCDDDATCLRWQTPAEPAAPGVPPVVPPGGGWEMPTAVAVLLQQQGYVIAGVGARIIAWLIDVTLAGIVPGTLAFAVVDWTGTGVRPSNRRGSAPADRSPDDSHDDPGDLGLHPRHADRSWGPVPVLRRFLDEPLAGHAGHDRAEDARRRREYRQHALLQATKRWIALGWPLALLASFPPCKQSRACFSSA